MCVCVSINFSTSFFAHIDRQIITYLPIIMCWSCKSKNKLRSNAHTHPPTYLPTCLNYPHTHTSHYLKGNPFPFAVQLFFFQFNSFNIIQAIEKNHMIYRIFIFIYVMQSTCKLLVSWLYLEYTCVHLHVHTHIIFFVQK